jgi:ethanolamine utilization protein EutQ
MSCFIVREKEARELKPSVLLGKVSEKAFISHAVDAPESKHMTAGFLRLDPGYNKELELPLDEVDLFIEGSLTLNFEGKTLTAQKGDVLFIEKGGRVHFESEEGCLVFYVTYPLMQEAMDEALKKLNAK